MTLADARGLFPGSQNAIYLNVSVKGLVSTAARDVARRYVDARVETGGDKAEMQATVERTRESFAELVGAHPDEIALTKNVSEGIGAIATSLPWQPGDNVVICAELEHPNNVYPWLSQRERLGVDVRMVPPDGGRVPAERMAEAVDERTRLVTVPTVTFSPGLLTDIAPLAEACRAHDAFFLVDAAQSVGVIDTDVRALGVDALATAAQKAMGGFYGTGFLYVRRERAESIHPASLARYGVGTMTGGHETLLHTDHIPLAAGARRFDLGNYNYLGFAVAEAAMDVLQQFGLPSIQAHARGLARRLAEGLAEEGLPMAGGLGPDLGHIVAVGEAGAGRHDTTDDPVLASLYGYLTDHGVVMAVRRGVLRMGLHVYNNDEDVDRVLDLVREWRRRA
jgi:selenocysteine lyase/cysteine desulfurase